MTRYPISCLIVTVLLKLSVCKNPVLLLHGVNDDYKRLQPLAEKIARDFPGTVTHPIRLFPDLSSLFPLERQSRDLIQYITNLNISGPVTLLGHSMGALTVRHAIQNWAGHNVTTFISLAGPHMGVCAIENFPRDSGSLNETFSLTCYNEVGQDTSLCNLWNDPIRQGLYKKHNKFLSASLCQTRSKLCAPQADNLTKLDKMVLAGGPDDGTVIPYNSCLFGYYDKEWGMVGRKDQPFYGRLGLKKLEKQNKIVECIKPGVLHVDFVTNEEVYKDCIKPHIS